MISNRTLHPDATMEQTRSLPQSPRMMRAMGLVLLLAAWFVLSGWGIFGSDNSGPPHDEDAFGHNWNGSPVRDLRQNHKIHTQDEEIDCETCHTGAVSEPRAGIVEMEACADCHDGADEGVANKGECLLCHVVANLPAGCTAEACTENLLPDISTSVGPKPYRNLKYAEGDQPGFSHAAHAKKKVACSECHGNIALEEGNPFPSGKWMPRPEQCLGCHQEVTEKQIPSTCDTCHVESTFAKDVPPPTHRGNWTAFHGAVSQLTLEGQHGQDCTTCHTSSDCADCHATEPPRDHTNFWRVRGHGLTASMDQESCATCHRQDFCTSCHVETAPRTHIGNWVGKHCVNCHLTDSKSPQEGCSACHKQALHVSAPHPVITKRECTSCHTP